MRRGSVAVLIVGVVLALAWVARERAPDMAPRGGIAGSVEHRENLQGQGAGSITFSGPYGKSELRVSMASTQSRSDSGDEQGGREVEGEVQQEEQGARARP